MCAFTSFKEAPPWELAGERKKSGRGKGVYLKSVPDTEGPFSHMNNGGSHPLYGKSFSFLTAGSRGRSAPPGTPEECFASIEGFSLLRPPVPEALDPMCVAPSGVLGQAAKSHAFLLPRTLETSDLESRTGNGAAKTLMAGRKEGDPKPWEGSISAYDTLGSTIVPDLGTGLPRGGRVLQTGLPFPAATAPATLKEEHSVC